MISFSEKKNGGLVAAESSTFDVRLLDAAGFRWDKERVTDYELYR